jgi:hypothetical protein
MDIEMKLQKVIIIELSEYEAQELFNAIMPIVTDKIETPNYIRKGVELLYRGLKKKGFKYVGD